MMPEVQYIEKNGVSVFSIHKTFVIVFIIDHESR